MVKSAFMPLAILVAFGFYKSPIAQAQLTRAPFISTDWREERDQWLGPNYDQLLEKCDAYRNWNAYDVSVYSRSGINRHRQAHIYAAKKFGYYLTQGQLGARVSGLLKATKTACPDVW